MEYKELYLPNHHRAKVNGCVDEHIILAEKKIGRQLKDQEVVHHKDGNKLNNSLDNLMIFVSNSAHITFHKGGKLIEVEEGVYDCQGLPDKYCCQCGVKLKTKQGNICQDCNHYNQRKVTWPSPEQLLNDIKELKTNIAISKKYGVSDKTIAKWRKTII